MSSQRRFKLSRQAAWLALIAAAYPLSGMPASAPAAVARVDFAVGGVVATGSDGKSRKLIRGESIFEGDLIATSDGRAQLRFTDGGYMSLQPQTEFRVDDYRFAGQADGSERGFFSLLKGGMRTITGIVGRSNPPNYQLRTTVATIGIRGTEYTVTYTNSILHSVANGGTTLVNGAGSFNVNAGETVMVKEFNTPPTRVSTRPDVGPTPAGDLPPLNPPPNPFQETASLETLRPPPPPLPAAPVVVPVVPVIPAALGPLLTGLPRTLPLSVAFAHNGDGGEGSFFSSSHVELYASSPTTLNAQGFVTAFQDPPLGPQFANTWGGMFANTGNDGIIAWGRWTNGTVGTVDGGEGAHRTQEFSNGRSLHYIVGVPTANMPTTGTGNYTFLGGTNPTSNSGAVGTLTGGTLTANFGTARVNTAINFTLAGGIYTTTGTNLVVTGNTFSGGTAGTTATGAGCACGCSNTIISGFFAGDAAARAGLGYSFIDETQGKTVGTAAFKKSSALP